MKMDLEAFYHLESKATQLFDCFCLAEASRHFDLPAVFVASVSVHFISTC